MHALAPVALVAAAAIVAGCIGEALRGPFVDRVCAVPLPEERPEPTACALEAGHAFLVWRLGDALAARALRAEPGRSYYDGPSYADCLQVPTACTDFVATPKWGIVSRIHDPEQPFVNQTVEVKVAMDGKVLRRDVNFPDCVAQPGECVFLDQQMALRLAQAAGLPEGLRPWEAKLHDHRQHGYVWSVNAVVKEEGRNGEGRVAQFDANDGRFLGLGPYFWISD